MSAQRRHRTHTGATGLRAPRRPAAAGSTARGRDVPTHGAEEGERQRTEATEGESPPEALPPTTGGSFRQRHAGLLRWSCEARSPSRPRAVEQRAAQPQRERASGWNEAHDTRRSDEPNSPRPVVGLQRRVLLRAAGTCQRAEPKRANANVPKSRKGRARPKRRRRRLAGATASGTRGCRGGGARQEAEAGRAR